MARELELKLATDPDTLAALVATRLPAGWQAGPWQTQRLGNRYYDTDDHELRDRGIGLRLRQANEQFTQTIKTAGSSVGGLHRRNEWNVNVAGPELDPVRLPETEWTPWLTSLWRQQKLLTVFSTDFERRSRELRHDSGTVIEFALDHGAVHADEEHDPISEVEMELLAGDIEPLFELARQLIAHHPLHPDSRSKAERGYRLLGWHDMPTTRLQPILIKEGATLWQILFDTVTNAWSHWQLYEKEFVSKPSVAAAEQMRRALGLFRHALVCYSGLPLPLAMHGWRRQLTHMLKAFRWVGTARAQLAADDIVWSSQGENFLPHHDELVELLPDERDFASGIIAVENLLDSRRYALFAINMGQFLAQAPSDIAPALLLPADERATELVIRQWEALQKIWDSAPHSQDFGFYDRQKRLLRRALWSCLIFGELFDDRQRALFINPCRDLLAGIQDNQTLASLDHLGRELSDAEYRDFTGWLFAQRETLWSALQMTREFALRAEPETLENG
ncbi:CYTH domain-containing protein [Permianibacter sp. IMCC34836]|uniref:CYTH and CHAD domain-containing protein n=1 Tax=Permianibacter fluminis TaxID=2738515 RepID=UPI001552991A|nr:CYTH and CHAD domain-containing protein [Permianibacter fluminis]NQD35429.1 CYTH domain-containing protein [Permianibacter fluminis]